MSRQARPSARLGTRADIARGGRQAIALRDEEMPPLGSGAWRGMAQVT